MTALPVLSVIVGVPLLTAAVVAVVDRRRAGLLYGIGLAGMLAVLAVAAWIVVRFDPSSASLQFVERARWIPSVGIGYHVGVDGISLPLVVLTAVMMPLALLSAWGSITERVKELVVVLLLVESALLGTFVAQDLVLFYVFWEAVLLPMYFLIGLWGGSGRARAAVKFLLYTMAGSALMLVAIIVLYLQSGVQLGARTFDLVALQGMRLDPALEAWLFAAFTLALAIKVPVWPLHTWLPDAHTEAPTAGSVILAAVLLKMGTYGFLRLVMPLFAPSAVRFAPALMALAVVGVLYGGAVAWAQDDVKRLIATSSVSHLGLITLGIFALSVEAVQGSLLQMVNHGISTGGLFLLVGVLYDRTHSRRMDDYGGVASLMPRLAPLALIVVLSSLALPATNGFVGEFLVLLGTYRVAPRYAIPAVGGVILSAAYLLWMYQKVMHGPVAVRQPTAMRDLTLREQLVLWPLVVLIFWIGLYPAPLLRRSEASVRALVVLVRERADAPLPPHTPAGLATLRAGVHTDGGPSPDMDSSEVRGPRAGGDRAP
jgi:NADH-quinone oxidoreductase subunit M